MLENLPFLYKLLRTPSPSGYEYNIQKVVMEEMKNDCDKVITHQNYNVIHVVNPDSPMKILLSGHIDEIGLIIEEIKSNGTCKLCSTGGIRPYMYIGQHVNVICVRGQESHTVPGIIGYLPNMGKNEVKTSDLVLDLGTTSAEETKKLVRVGDAVVHMNDYVKLYGDTLSGRALDDKLGAFICLEAMKKAKEKGCKNGIYVSTTVGEETTGRGASAAADTVKPTCAIIVDVTYSNDLPYRENLSGTITLGKGPALTIGSEMNQIMKELMIKASEKLNMKVQFEIASSRTYTDTDDIFHRQSGIPCYLVSIPLRYMHSSVELCNLKDVEDIIDLLAEFMMLINENTNFNPFQN